MCRILQSYIHTDKTTSWVIYSHGVVPSFVGLTCSWYGSPTIFVLIVVVVVNINRDWCSSIVHWYCYGCEQYSTTCNFSVNVFATPIDHCPGSVPSCLVRKLVSVYDCSFCSPVGLHLAVPEHLRFLYWATQWHIGGDIGNSTKSFVCACLLRAIGSRI